MALHHRRTQGDVFGYARSCLLILRGRQYGGHRGTSHLCQSTLPDSRAAKKGGGGLIETLLSFVPPTSWASCSWFSRPPQNRTWMTGFPASRTWWIFGWFGRSSRRQAEVRRDLGVARFIDLMLPISFKPLLKYLSRYSLVNDGKLLERKRGGYTHKIGINGL